jgi:protein-S-isoprenylcysteine O-methyltransferase Ste14
MTTAQHPPELAHKPLSQTRFFHLRGLIGGILLLPSLVIVSLSKPILSPDSPYDEVLESIGWILLALYVTCRVWATLYVGGRKDRTLQTEGIYSVTRNPLYLGSLCYTLAAAFFFESPLVLGLSLLLLGYYLLKIIPSEEAVLRGRFGAKFETYTQQTPRFFPRFRGYRPAGDVTIDIEAVKREARRLWGAALLPIVADLFEALRTSPHWPHLFRWL